MTEHQYREPTAVKRRTIVKASAWSLPVIAMGVAVPAQAASGTAGHIEVMYQPFTGYPGAYTGNSAVRVVDKNGNPVAGVPVTFTILSSVADFRQNPLTAGTSSETATTLGGTGWAFMNFLYAIGVGTVTVRASAPGYGDVDIILQVSNYTGPRYNITSSFSNIAFTNPSNTGAGNYPSNAWMFTVTPQTFGAAAYTGTITISVLGGGPLMFAGGGFVRTLTRSGSAVANGSQYLIPAGAVVRNTSYVWPANTFSQSVQLSGYSPSGQTVALYPTVQP
ncbi:MULTISPECIES: hypothetical protein [unclassified Microbacterium]|uniref:hypothetical protein n=1 Tax=unclassified Microbacterium TaxID=2609290 RepID=UPI003658CCF2